MTRRSAPRRPLALWLHGHMGQLAPTVRGLLWSAAADALFSRLHAVMRTLALQAARTTA